MATWSKHLVCEWESWTAIDEWGLELRLPADNACDMAGCIKVAQLLLPTVSEIHVFVDGVRDLIYSVDHKGKWSAGMMRSERN